MFNWFKRKDIMSLNAEKARTMAEAINSVREVSDLKKILKKINYFSKRGYDGCRFYTTGYGEDPIFTKEIENILKEKGFEICHSDFEVYVSWKE